MNQITDKTTEKEHLEVYSSYPEVMKGGLEENPHYTSRIAPIYYEIRDGAKVLDIGCNNGEFLKLLKDKKECKVYGVDLSEIAVKEAVSKGLNVQIGSGENLPFPDKTFDYVCLMEVIAHVLNPDKVISEIRRVLKKDGVLLGSTPHKNLEDYIGDDRRLHRRYYTQSDLTLLLRKKFKRIFLNTLTGGQFSLGFAESHLAYQDAEMLFKCGGKNIKNWEEDLLDRSILRVWFGPTQQEGTVYYRMTGFIEKLRELNKGELNYEDYDRPGESPGKWQNKLLRSSHFPDRCVSPTSMDHLWKCLKASDFSVWQVTPYRDILAFLLMAKEKLQKPLVVEIDDWIFDLPSYNIASNPYKPNSECEWTSYEQMKMATAFICSTNFIKEKLVEWFPGKPCFMVKNSIDFKVYDNLNPTKFVYPKSDSTRIIYTGCANHDGDIEIVKEPLMALLNEFPKLEVLLPFSFPSWDGLQHERLMKLNQWAPIKEYPNALAGFEGDIGIAPLRDNDFNRAKSNLRWLEYSAIKIPTVASPIEPFKCIQDGKTGFLADNKLDWYEKLKALIVSKELREKMGRLAYNEVKQNYNMDTVANEYLSVLKAIKKGV